MVQQSAVTCTTLKNKILGNSFLCLDLAFKY